MPIILDQKLYDKVKAEADQRYKKPSAYKSGWIVKTYKERGGEYGDDNQPKNLARWYKEDWEDIGNQAYPVYRPTKRISKKTPLTADEIDPKQAKKQIKLKQIIKGDANLPPFEKKGGVLEGGWTFSGRNWSPETFAYNALLNGLTENYRNDITPSGVGEDIGRNIKEVFDFSKNPNLVSYTANKALGQASRYGKGRKKGGKLRANEIRNLLEASYQTEPPEKIDDWILDRGLSNQYGKVYYKPDGSAVVAHRGTSGTLDWGNNLAYALGNYENTDRYKQGKKIQEEAERKYGAKNISTLGHSQGSVLSRKLGQNTKEIINVNPAYKGETPLKNEYNIRSSKDVVSGLYAPVSSVSKLLYPSYTKKHSITIPTDKSFDVLGNHSYDILNKLGDDYIGEGAGVKKTENYPDWEDLKWGSFTAQFKRYNQTHPHSPLPDLESFAKMILTHPENYHQKTLKRARFYQNVILKKSNRGMLRGGMNGVPTFEEWTANLDRLGQFPQFPLIDEPSAEQREQLENSDDDEDTRQYDSMMERHRTHEEVRKYLDETPEYPLIPHRGRDTPLTDAEKDAVRLTQLEEVRIPDLEDQISDYLETLQKLPENSKNYTKVSKQLNKLRALLEKYERERSALERNLTKRPHLIYKKDGNYLSDSDSD